MGRVNHPGPPIVSIEESKNVADKASLDARLAIRRRGDGNSDPSFRESPGLCNTACSEELLRPIHYLNKAAYPEYGSHRLVLNNWITLKLIQARLENIEEHSPE